jgi:hypothetical protein
MLLSTSINRVYAIPRECRDAFVWLMDLCKEIGIDVSNTTFTSTKQGRFLKAEGTIRLNEHTATFLVSDFDASGSMSVHVTTSTGKQYRVYHEHLYDPLPTYPLGGLMEARSEEEADALAEIMEGLFVDE